MDKPYETKSAVEWKVKDTYECRLLEIQEVDNDYYTPAEKLDEKYGKRPEGQYFWLDEKEQKHYADHPDERTQFQYKFEVVEEGDHKGDWVWMFSKHYFTADGKGKRSAFAKAIDPDIDLSIGIDNDALIGKFVRLTIEPPVEGKKYPRVVDFMPTKLTDKQQKSLVFETLEDGDEIPF
jgi:hypothetical protein